MQSHLLTSHPTNKPIAKHHQHITHRHSSCCSRCLVRWTDIGTQKLRQVQGLTLPPTPFLPCMIKKSKVHLKWHVLRGRAEPTFRGHLAVSACERTGRDSAKAHPRLLLEKVSKFHICHKLIPTIFNRFFWNSEIQGSVLNNISTPLTKQMVSCWS